MFKDLLNNLQNQINTKKEENNNYNNLLTKTNTFQNLFPLPNLTNENITEYKLNYIQNECPDLNKEKATLIASLIPLQEEYLTVIYSKEVLTNIEYYLIPTTKYLWIINQKSFGALAYQNLTCTIIKNNLLSKILLLNNILIEASGTTKVNNFLNILTNFPYREQKILKKIAYLCGITPIYQQINSIKSGISIDSNKTIVFHTKDRNYRLKHDQIKNYEILLDNNIYTSKATKTSTSIGSFNTSCYQISLRITTHQNQILLLPILPPKATGSTYSNKETAFRKSLDFALTIINKLDELFPKY